MATQSHPRSFYTWLFICLALVFATHLKPFVWTQHEVLIWDAFAYYLYLPSVFIYDDLQSLQYLQEAFFDTYQQPASGYASALPGGEGYILKTTMGLAGMYFPFFLLAHLFALLSSYPADGFSLPYQYAIVLGNLFYALLGLGLLRRVLLNFFSDGVVAAVLLLLALGTHFLHYAAFKAGESHIVLFALYALLLWLTHRWHRRPRKWSALAIGAVAGMIILIRPTDIVCLLIPLLWGVSDRASLKRKLAFLRLHWREVLLAGGAIALAGLPQLLYWKLYSGQWLYYSYDEQGFDFLHPNLNKGLFSWHKGWLIYTPLMVFSLLGFIPLFRQQRQVFWAVLTFVAVNLYVVYSWEAWAYGGGFGARPLLQSYAVLALPLGAWVSWLGASRWRRALGYPLLGLCLLHNLIFTWHANAPQGGLVTENMNRSYYLYLLGHLHVPKDAKKLLDAPRVLRDTSHMQRRTLYFNDYENPASFQQDKRHVYSGQYSCRIDPIQPISPSFRLSVAELSPRPGSWLRLSARIFFEEREWDIWRQPVLTVQFLKDGRPHQRNQIRLYWLAEAGKWLKLHVDKPLPRDITPTDTLEVFVHLDPTNHQPLWVDDLKVEYWEPLP